MFGFLITLNIWKDIGNDIFPNGFINFPKFWKDSLSTTFQLLEGPHFIRLLVTVEIETETEKLKLKN